MKRAGQGALWAGAAIVLGLAVVAIAAPRLAPDDPRALSGGSFEDPSSAHLLGTNDLGQDILSELVWGTRTSLIVALGASILGVVLGLVAGPGARLIGKSADLVMARVIDVALGLPTLPVVVVLAAFVGPSRGATIAVIGFLAWPRVARILRSQTLQLRERGFIAAARGFGCGPLYVLRRHLAPALAPLAVASFVTLAGLAVRLEASLAFLGLGDPTAVSWGQVLNRAIASPGIYFTSRWLWWIVPAGLAVTLAVTGFVLIGVGLEPRFNRRLDLAR